MDYLILKLEIPILLEFPVLVYSSIITLLKTYWNSLFLTKNKKWGNCGFHVLLGSTRPDKIIKTAKIVPTMYPPVFGMPREFDTAFIPVVEAAFTPV
jgi:hypothetical protein